MHIIVHKEVIEPAEIHFGEGGTLTGEGSMYIGYDGPNYSDNNNYWYVKYK